jgi:hypothetical protein
MERFVKNNKIPIIDPWRINWAIVPKHQRTMQDYPETVRSLHVDFGY